MTNPFNTRLLGGRLASLVRSASAAQKAFAAAAGQAAPGGKPAVTELIGRVLDGALPAALAGALAPRPPGGAAGATGLPPGAAFHTASYTGPAGTRPYQLYVPAQPGQPAPLVVMLHGCTQTAADFATGTRMNEVAEAHGAYVLYPVQVPSANAQRCWNWFNPADQARDGGEAALIAGMTRAVMEAHQIDASRVFVAGLSAGGAQAAILAATYPELFAAAGIHSGLACGAARDVTSAFQAMRQGHAGQGRHRTRTIVFHGDRDSTVSPRNADAVANQVEADGPVQTEQGVSAGGLGYTRTVQRDRIGRPVLERWLVHKAGHAWSGGSSQGSFTEPAGPDASGAMMAFFLA